MRVLHVISDKNIGGAGVLLCTLLHNFDTERVQSVVALPRESALLERIGALGVPVRELRHSCDRLSGGSVREIREIVETEQADLVHANAALSARLAGKMCHVPVLHTRHCCYPPRGVWKLSSVRHLGGALNRWLSDRVIATADAAAENLRQLGIPPEQIEVILNGSEPIRTVGYEELRQLRTRWNLRESDFCVGICARLESCKGHETFLEAAKLILERLPQVPFRFLIVGTGSREEHLRRLTERLGISSAVRFLGFVSDMAPVYRLLRINVNCSKGTETSCLALSEGMSASLPTVASDYGGNRAMIGESGAGILFPVGDCRALSDAICHIATSTILERSMRDAAQMRYLQKYTAVHMTEHLTRVYESLASASAGKHK